MNRALLLVFAVVLDSLAFGAPTVVRVTPATVPAYLKVEVSPVGCDTKRLSPDHVAIWYATVKAKVVDLKSEPVGVEVQLRDPKTNAFLFNPGTSSVVEGDYLIVSGKPAAY